MDVKGRCSLTAKAGSGLRIFMPQIKAMVGPSSLAFMADLICQDERLVKIYGDQAYNGVFAEAIRKNGIDFEKASKAESASGFIPVAKRWVVERTFAWTNFFRRLVKDYEYTVSSSVSWLFLAKFQLMLQRIKPISET
jgi:transposase